MQEQPTRIKPDMYALLHADKQTESADIKIQQIEEYVCETFHTNIEEIKGRKRIQNIVRARQLLLACRYILGWNFRECGEAYNRHHATVIHSIGAVYWDVKAKNFYYDSILKTFEIFGLTHGLERLNRDMSIWNHYK